MDRNQLRAQFDALRMPLLFSLVADAERIEDRALKLEMVKILLQSPKLKTVGLDRLGVLLLVEDKGSLRPHSHLWTLVESTCLLQADADGRYRLRDRVELADFPNVSLPPGFRGKTHPLTGAGWTLDEIHAAFLPKRAVAWTVRTVKDALALGYDWLRWTLNSTHEWMTETEPAAAILPAFWECDGEEDTPVGRKKAVTSIGDTTGALSDSLLHPWCAGRLGAPDFRGFDDGLRQLLSFIANPTTHAPWDRGGFLPLDDQPESKHPTCDATWDAVLALGSVYDFHDTLSERFGAPLTTSREEIGRALLNGASFLIRMRLPTGGWGVYRFENDIAPVPAYEFTTAQTILALRLALLPSALEDLDRAVERALCEQCLREAWDFLKQKTVTIDGLTIWAPYFSDDPGAHGAGDLLRATMWTATGALALRRGFSDLADTITPRLNDFLTFADRHWAPNYERIAEAEFRVPLDDRLHDSFAKWSNRFDVTMAIILLDLFNESRDATGKGLKFPDELWPRLEETIGAILEEQHPKHGHWNEPVAGLPLAAATAMAIQALQQYLIAARHLIQSPDGPASSP